MWRLANIFSHRPTALSPKWTLVRTMAKKKSDEYVVTPCEAARFCEEALCAAGACRTNAKEVAHVLVAADYYGHSAEGILKLGWYTDELSSGKVDGNARPAVLKETSAMANVDGCNALGACVANFCNTLALQKARDCGVGYVSARHSNHFGIASYYTRFVVGCGLIGVAMSVGSPIVIAAGSKQAVLGSNPISVAAPGCNGDNFILDMATSNVSIGQLEKARLQKKKIPAESGLGKKGSLTADAADALATKKLLPLGGLRHGYKGYGLAVAIDVLCSVLSGALSGPYIAPHDIPKDSKEKPRHSCLGMSFLVLDPDAFESGFQHRLTTLLSALRSSEPADVCVPVWVAGDKSKANAEACDCRGGISYTKHERAAMEEIAKRFKIRPMQTSLPNS